ncbi:filamentous hemagglutinin N-terminal domain-containing protein [Scytonema sp. NUACC26]|uniref:two-partner secretion domain-containing protein n=1 Tax=Scytonema sp. NUACC26 TaxID=3140176 RepID=UPI0034DC0BF0
MNQSRLRAWVLTGNIMSALLCAQSTAAQVVPDTTLPVGERSLVTGNGNVQIDGGARRGDNLFHSFSQFSIPMGGTAFFNNAVDVQNILTRVTGQSISNINGLIRANGTANLFLINPNGIIFGPNARLNIGGSFVASTASSIQFADGTEFNAVNPSAPPLLTISVPIGLQFNGGQGDIVVQAPVPNNPFTEVGNAGQLLSTAQPNDAIDGTTFNTISGNFANGDDVDLYKVTLTKGVPFTATTVNGTKLPLDTQLFLFNGSGLGLSSNDDTADAVLLRSTVPLNQPFIPAASGIYYLGISLVPNNPLSPQGYIFGSSGAPNGSGSELPLSGWDAKNNLSGSASYTITLNPHTPLQVQPGKTLALVGGNVTIQGSNLQAPNGRVELGGVAQSGRVGLNVDGNNIAVSFPNQVVRADVSLSEGSGIDATGISGSIRILARNIDISRSVLQMGIPSASRLPGTQRDLDLNATGLLTISDNSFSINLLNGQGKLGNINLTAGDRVSLDSSSVHNTVQLTGIGNAGEINITTGSLSLTNNAQLRSEISGQGNAGSININARDAVSFDNSRIYNNVQSTGIGNAGEIDITTGSFSVRGAGLTSFSNGQGNSSTVNINARDTVSFDDFGSILTLVQLTGVGNAGDINIITGSFSLEQGQLSSYGTGLANAGNITINARDTVSLTQGAFLSSRASAPKNSGSVNINAGNSVSLDGFSQVSTNFGINITTGDFSLTRGSVLNSYTSGQGDSGSVTINARDRVTIDGESDLLYGTFRSTSQIFTYVSSSPTRRGVGRGGDVSITTGSLFLTNGGAINTFTQGQGNAGYVTINARDAVQISGTAPSYLSYSPPTSPNSDYSAYSGVRTSAELGSVGDGGNVSITTGTLFVSDSGTINTTAQGQGRAGNIQIRASNAVSFNGGNAISTLGQGAVGRGGDIAVEARSLSVLNNAQFSASTAGNGNAGNITASADTVNVNSGGRLLTTTSSNSRAGDITVKTPNLQLSGATSGLFADTTSAGNAGNLTIQPRGNGQRVRVNLQDGAQISASTSSSGRGGDLTLAAPESITLTGNGSIIAAGTGGSGAGGNLTLKTGTFNIQNQAEVTVSSSGTGRAGTLFVDADRVSLNNQGSIRADTTGGGGNINVRSPFILLRNGSNITTNARGSNIPGGNIGIDTRFLVAVLSEDSNISANSEDFRGGNVRINASSIFGILPDLISTPLSDITATGATSALGGTIDVTTAGIDPTSGLVVLPTDLVDSSGLIAQGCSANQGNSFVITGRGGLPPNPEQQLDDDAEWSDRRRLVVAGRERQADKGTQGHGESLATRSASSIPYPPIMEATGWQRTPTGEILLVANSSNPAVQNSMHQLAACNGRQ